MTLHYMRVVNIVREIPFAGTVADMVKGSA